MLRAFDAHDDPQLPRGKQDWRRDPHVIWYHRSTGIWRSVWIEEVPELHVRSIDWDFDLPTGSVGYVVRLPGALPGGAAIGISLTHEDETLAHIEVVSSGDRVAGRIELPTPRNAQDRERLLWTPEQPVLIDAAVVVRDHGTGDADETLGYLGLRTTAVGRGMFLLNRMPYFIRSVLEQGYWPETHLAAPSPVHLRLEVELIKELGFNALQVHQKVEDPRFHHCANRVGLLVWVETAAAYEYTPDAAGALMSEWLQIVAQYRNHPSVVTWVPVNESWGVQDLADDPAQRSFVRAITEMTRALDPNRPVVSNDGWVGAHRQRPAHRARLHDRRRGAARPVRFA